MKNFDVNTMASLQKNNDIALPPAKYSIDASEVTEYIIQLQFGDQTQNMDATKVLRNFNFVIACNIWLFMYDKEDKDIQWNMIIPLKDDEKQTANIDLNTSKHQYKATKHKIKATKYKIANSSIVNTISRIPNALRIGIQTGISQTAESASLIVLGGFAVLVSNVAITKFQIEDNIAEPSPKKLVKSAGVIPLWACVSLIGGVLGGAVAVAAIPVNTVGSAGYYLYSGSDTANEFMKWHIWNTCGGLGGFSNVLNWLVDQRPYDQPKFKQVHTLEKRKQESARILRKYPDRIPVVCEKARGEYFNGIDNKIFLNIKTKYLVPSDLTVGQFIYVIRKKVQLPPELAMFCFVNNTLPSMASLMSEVYRNHKDEDGFLYTTYQGEHCFG